MIRRCPPRRRRGRAAARTLGSAFARGCGRRGSSAAPRTLAQSAGLSEYELRDIGLSRQDLVDFTARPLDDDPADAARIARRPA